MAATTKKVGVNLPEGVEKYFDRIKVNWMEYAAKYSDNSQTSSGETPEEIAAYKKAAEEKASKLAEEKARNEVVENWKVAEIQFYKRLAEEKTEALKKEKLQKVNAINAACNSALFNVLFSSNLGSRGECREMSRSISLKDWSEETKDFLIYFWKSLEIAQQNDSVDLDMLGNNKIEETIVSNYLKSIGNYDEIEKAPFILNRLKKRFSFEEICFSLRFIYTKIAEVLGIDVNFGEAISPIEFAPVEEVQSTPEQEEEILKNCNDSAEIISILQSFLPETDRFNLSKVENKCFICSINDGTQLVIANLGKDFSIMVGGIVEDTSCYIPVSLTKNENIARSIISERRLWLTESEIAEVMKTCIDPRILPYVDTGDRVITLTLGQLKKFNEKLLNLINIIRARYERIPRFRISAFKSVNQFNLVYDNRVELVCPGTFTSDATLPGVSSLKVKGNVVRVKDHIGTEVLALEK